MISEKERGEGEGTDFGFEHPLGIEDCVLTISPFTTSKSSFNLRHIDRFVNPSKPAAKNKYLASSRVILGFNQRMHTKQMHMTVTQ